MFGWMGIFWSSLALLVYIYLGYPALIALRTRLRPAPIRKGKASSSYSIVISAYNEARRIQDKLESIFRENPPPGLEEVVVASDGSDDGTAARARAFNDARLRVIDFPVRRGKAAVLNEIVPACRGEMVILTDARQPLAPGALQALLESFSDPDVGVVSGELIFREGLWSDQTHTGTACGMGFYWRYEKFIRRNEAGSGSVPGATGALYAIRRALFRPIAPETLLDDVAIPMQAVVRGARCVFEPEARVYDEPSNESSRELVRKRRTLAGNAQLMRLYPAWLLPWRNPIWFQYVSHKLLRLVSPWLLLALLVATIALLPHGWLYRLFFLFELAACALATLGWVVGRGGRRTPAMLALPMMFVTLNVAAFLGMVDAVTGKHQSTWERAYEDQ